MNRLYSLALLIGGIAIAWWVIPKVYTMRPDIVGVGKDLPKGEPAELPLPHLPPAKLQKSFRAAVWDVTPLDRAKASQAAVMKAIAAVVRRFDMTILQGVDLHDRAVLTVLLDAIRESDGPFGYVTVPEPLRLNTLRGTVIVFDMRAVEYDQRTVRVVDDPQRRIRTFPLTAAFRARGVPPEHAFTFSLLSVDLDPFLAERELVLLSDIVRAVRDDGRGEDDVIVVGNFAVSAHELLAALRSPDAVCVNQDLPTDVTGTASTVNLAFDGRATVEYTGRHGVFDLIREFELSPAQAQQVAPHLPVWAEFSVYESGSP